jgi:hypothetical protein
MLLKRGLKKIRNQQEEWLARRPIKIVRLKTATPFAA